LISKVVIPAAGLGTRLLPMTKELPKEMLPLFFYDSTGRISLKPVLQAIFEQLFDVGFREFGFIVGRGKRAVEDHFTPDEDFIDSLKSKNKEQLLYGLLEFYEKLKSSSVLFINQPSPKGFGDAVHKAKPFTREEPFMLHAGDDLVFSRDNRHFAKMISIFERYEADVVFLLEEVNDPRKYGVIKGNEVSPGVFTIEGVFEKPETPPSNLAIVASYIFKPIIYKAIENTLPDKNGEIQLTDALQLLLSWGCRLYASKLGPGERRVDIGTPETYLATVKYVLNRQTSATS
jgi:UTP--glucose-1-phosphate uridylyltransferase